MPDLLSVLTTAKDLLLVVIGFSVIIILHELGHFLAARWAGIRVLAFALGFGPAMVSWRKGLGVRRGSSEEEVNELRHTAAGEAGPERDAARLKLVGVSNTEYRWNILPLGGYVKMLGQDDADPTAKSDAPDSYNMCVPWKRMVVISAGVVMNIITAAVLFMIVFRAGLTTEAASIGYVVPGSPAATAVADNAKALGVTEPGLKPGDDVISIDGAEALSFKDIQLTSAMAAKGSKLDFVVKRVGVMDPLRFSIEPKFDPGTRFMAVGVAPAQSTTLANQKSQDDRKSFEKLLSLYGLQGAVAGAKLTSAEVNGTSTPLLTAADLDRVALTSNGSPITLVMEAGGQTSRAKLMPVPELQRASFKTLSTSGVTQIGTVDHILGLAAVMTAESTPGENAVKAGLRPGDVFAQLGDIAWPTRDEGTAEIKKRKGKTIDAVVWRAKGAEPDSPRELVKLDKIPVLNEGSGIVGFNVGSTAHSFAILASWPKPPLTTSDPDTSAVESPNAKTETRTPEPSGVTLGLPPGAILTKINDLPVRSLTDVRTTLQQLASTPGRAGDLTVQVGFRRTLATASPLDETTSWTIPASEIASLQKLSWLNPLPSGLFEPKQTLLHADSLSGAIGMGLRETRNIMVQTYLTFARLIQGSVKVEHLRGPVGIAHVGTLLADKGFIWLLFFMAAISVNLAVVNFLPLPVVDGGHFLFLLYEQITGKPVSVALQNVATLAGLALILSVFLVVTYNDVIRLFGLST